MSRRGEVTALVGIGICLGCAQQAGTSTQADMDAIHRVNQEWTDAIRSGNVDAIMAPLTADAMLLPPNEPAATGSAEVRAWSQRMGEQVVFTEVRTELEEVVVAGDWAFSRGTFHGTFQPRAGGPATSDVTKFVLIWRREPDGSWKIARDIWNSNNPMPAAP
jgi:ketosteroid isomerase-like protein